MDSGRNISKLKGQIVANNKYGKSFAAITAVVGGFTMILCCVSSLREMIRQSERCDQFSHQVTVTARRLAQMCVCVWGGGGGV